MDAASWTVIAIGAALLATIGASFRCLRERMAHLEGLLEGLREAVAGKRVPS